MRKLIAAAVFVASLASSQVMGADETKPTVVLVHGAFADTSSWTGVAEILIGEGYRVIAAANPLRGVAEDAADISSLLATVEGEVVLVGHSYGGSVISTAANGHDNVKALVFVAAFAPDAGESAGELAGMFPGGTLGDALAPPVPLEGGAVDLYIQQDAFHQQFAQDVTAEQAAIMAATQRPIAEAALGEASGEPAWKTIPSWFIYGDGDKNIPAEGLRFMAERAEPRSIVVIEGGSHVVMVSQPQAVADIIEQAAQ